ncbi:hypothetical protein Tco_1335738 [Tanacetum coccineum]
MEGVLKWRNMVLLDSEDEETEAQGRKFQDDPLSKGKNVVTGLDFHKELNAGNEELNAGNEELNTGNEGVNTGGITVSTGSGQKKKRLKLLKRQKNKFFKKKLALLKPLEEDWNIIRAKLEANAELKESVLGKDLNEEDFAKKMVELVNQRKKQFGTWKSTQLKKLTFEEVKAEFEKLVRQVDTFVPMSFEATKESLKRFGVELQTKTAKRLKVGDKDAQSTKEKVAKTKKDEPTKKKGKRRKQIARKGLHTDKDETKKDENSDEDDSLSGTQVPINPVPVATKPPSIVTYKIIKQGKKGVYQIIRADGAVKVYISFGAMLKDITKDDLTEIFRIVMQRYGMDGPEDEYEKVLWGYLKTMFDAPLSTDAIWSLPGQQRIINWVYYDVCRVHCLNLELAEIYMLTERSCPLSAEVCKVMLEKKLQGGKENEVCYQLLKRIEKQAGIKKD